MSETETFPNFTAGLCWVCGKLVSIGSRNHEKGHWFILERRKVFFEHTDCVKCNKAPQEAVNGSE